MKTSDNYKIEAPCCGTCMHSDYMEGTYGGYFYYCTLVMSREEASKLFELVEIPSESVISEHGICDRWASEGEGEASK